jgi:NAD(P)H dehydrogenase (quinone)
MTVLIPAATGRVASGLAKRLREAGVPVRALARDRAKASDALADGNGEFRGIELAVGALDDEAFLAEAMQGAEVAFLSIGTSPQQVALEKGFIRAARRAGLPHLIKLSTLDTAHDSPNPVGRWHADIEDELVPHQATFALLTMARRRSSAACLFRQMM